MRWRAIKACVMEVSYSGVRGALWSSTEAGGRGKGFKEQHACRFYFCALPLPPAPYRSSMASPCVVHFIGALRLLSGLRRLISSVSAGAQEGLMIYLSLLENPTVLLIRSR